MTTDDLKRAGVRVRSLVWKDILNPREDGPAEETGDFEATSPIGDFSVVYDGDEDVVLYPFCAWGPDENLGHYASVEASKAAAQQHYENAILSALEPIHE